MCQVNVFQAKTDFSKLIALLERKEEEEIVIARNGKPVAKLVLFTKDSGKQRIGCAKGLFTIPKDFTLLDFEVEQLLEGEGR
jgi:antitoxin (DNA-binding transcriptional repressor) of toxin-antitoxin stability system